MVFAASLRSGKSEKPFAEFCTEPTAPKSGWGNRFFISCTNDCMKIVCAIADRSSGLAVDDFGRLDQRVVLFVLELPGEKQLKNRGVITSLGEVTVVRVKQLIAPVDDDDPVLIGESRQRI